MVSVSPDNTEFVFYNTIFVGNFFKCGNFMSITDMTCVGACSFRNQ